MTSGPGTEADTKDILLNSTTSPKKMTKGAIQIDGSDHKKAAEKTHSSIKYEQINRSLDPIGIRRYCQ